MKILLAPNALKGSLSPTDFVRIGKQTLTKKHTVYTFPLSDGGDGFLNFFKTLYPHAKTKYALAKNAFLKEHRVPFLLIPNEKIAIIETAKICGLGNLSKKELDILHASSFGVGQVILKAVQTGAKKIYVGLGGVACNDGGAGMLQACGAVFTDKQGRELKPGAKTLLQLQQADFSKLKKIFKNIKITGVADVNNPLLGPKSSAKVFGPQKGATPSQVKLLDKAMARWARVIQRSTRRAIAHAPATAAAGAIAAGLFGGFGAKLISGSQFLMEKTPLEKWAKQVNLMITAEGKLDRQTFYGKAPLVVLKLAKKYKKPSLFICGKLDEKCLRNQRLAPSQIAVLTDFSKDETDAKKYAAHYVRRILKNI